MILIAGAQRIVLEALPPNRAVSVAVVRDRLGYPRTVSARRGVESVLRSLVQAGLVTVTTSSSGTRLYARTPSA